MRPDRRGVALWSALRLSRGVLPSAAARKGESGGRIKEDPERAAKWERRFATLRVSLAVTSRFNVLLDRFQTP